ncbi:YdaU family protein [Bartonella sp. B30(2025)]
MKHAHQQETPHYEASTLPYVCWYQNDFLGSVRGMRAHEIGIYTILLNEMYARGRPLELSTERLARLCGCDKRTFTHVLEMLIEEGKILNLANGLWNQRCENVFHERIKLLEQKSFAGRASAKKRNKINKRIQHLLNNTARDDERNSEAQREEEKQTPTGVCEKKFFSSSHTRKEREWGESFGKLSSSLISQGRDETENFSDSAKEENAQSLSRAPDHAENLTNSNEHMDHFTSGAEAVKHITNTAEHRQNAMSMCKKAEPHIAKGQRLPADWTADIHAAVLEGLSEEQARWQEKKFRDYWHAKSGKEALKVDWQATWRNWFRREIERLKENQERLATFSSHKASASHSSNDDAFYRNLINYHTL